MDLNNVLFVSMQSLSDIVCIPPTAQTYRELIIMDSNALDVEGDMKFQVINMHPGQ